MRGTYLFQENRPRHPDRR